MLFLPEAQNQTLTSLRILDREILALCDRLSPFWLTASSSEKVGSVSSSVLSSWS